jgi:hypothetical protein
MNLVDTQSLVNTLNNINNLFFFDKKITNEDKEKTALWISSRQGLKGSYENMFAPTENDFKENKDLFTGDRILSSYVATAHIVGEESCRTLIKLDVKNKDVIRSLEKATNGITRRLDQSKEEVENYGFYCCGKCSISLLRHINAGGISKYKKVLSNGIKTIKSLRSGDGKWKRFPFYYTLLFLSESDLPEAKDEIKYTLNYCERIYKRKLSSSNEVSKIRKALLERALNKY